MAFVKTGNPQGGEPVRPFVPGGMVEAVIQVQIAADEDLFRRPGAWLKGLSQELRLIEMEFVRQTRFLRFLAGQVVHRRQSGMDSTVRHYGRHESAPLGNGVNIIANSPRSRSVMASREALAFCLPAGTPALIAAVLLVAGGDCLLSLRGALRRGRQLSSRAGQAVATGAGGLVAGAREPDRTWCY